MLMFREQVRRTWRKAAVVEEAERPAIYQNAAQNALAVARENTLRQIPIRNVVSGVFEDPGLEERRREIDPALVDEQPAGRIVEAITPQALPPPAPPMPLLPELDASLDEQPTMAQATKYPARAKRMILRRIPARLSLTESH